jgi:hypothetical protein
MYFTRHWTATMNPKTAAAAKTDGVPRPGRSQAVNREAKPNAGQQNEF